MLCAKLAQIRSMDSFGPSLHFDNSASQPFTTTVWSISSPISPCCSSILTINIDIGLFKFTGRQLQELQVTENAHVCSNFQGHQGITNAGTILSVPQALNMFLLPILGVFFRAHHRHMPLFTSEIRPTRVLLYAYAPHEHRHPSLV